MYIDAPKYKFLKSLAKIILPLIFGAGAVSLTEIIPDQYSEVTADVMLALAVAAAPLLQNLWKTRDMDGNPLGAIIRVITGPTMWIALLMLGLGGCASLGGTGSITTEAHTVDADGTSFDFSQRANAGLFGKLDEAAGTMQTGIGADGAYHLSTGQHALGIDNTGQVEALQSLLAIVPILQALLASQPQAAIPPTP